ncbi:MAG: type III secretion T3S chaperone [Waddliaceae bacterium]|nr:type III secretion T3S chaperone [Waddliaceae bacterium]MBT3578461.1 type III secretion T3S chaperone [Waddliaceae bacterium]MBT4445086.1 type III secretion T3S chaperone [Waddliaceae bacterium]MBT6927893.1 type III secretion T3S chaperone [Waddliaceae bacterium]MBT7264831.1 type III secretion T3S chaperone [Waddliaceae bacterium]
MPEYPLQEVLKIKERRVDEAERVVKQREEELENEKDKLLKCEQRRDKVKQHYHDKIDQLRLTLDKETTSEKIQQMRAYIDVVQEKLVVEEQKVVEQKEQVKVAKQNLENAKEELRQRRQEVDKIEMHKKEWMKDMRKELELKEALELDEVGIVMHITKKNM